MANKYDIGVVGWWYNDNYGGTLTYYALHQILKSMGLSVLMIEKPSADPKFKPDYNSVPRRFALKKYNISNIYDPNRLGVLNSVCNAFISGSDQLYASWAWNLAGPANHLDFAAPNKNMIAYAASFGNSYVAPQDFVIRSSYYLHRFNSISVREDYAVDIVKDNFGLKAVQVLDPVFVCDMKEYEKLIEQSSFKKENDYMLNFILDPDDNKRDALIYASEKLGLPHINLINAMNFESNSKKLNLDNIKANADIEDWLAYYKNSEFVITDSFHGTCFAILFRKPFISIANKLRGDKRFVSLLKGFGLLDRLVDDVSEIKNNPKLFEPIDYNKVYKIIDKKRDESLKWLVGAVFNPPKKSVNGFNVMDKKVNENRLKIFELQTALNRQQREINALKARLEALEKK